MADPVSHQTILRFWTPLALTWAIMGIEAPIVSRAAAQLPEAAPNLAALGAAIAMAWLSETLVANLAACSLRLAQDGRSYRQMRRYAYVLAAISLIANCLLIATPALFDILRGPIDMSEDLARQSNSRAKLLPVLWL